MVDIQIRDSEIGDVSLLNADLRIKDKEEATRLGLDPEEVLRLSYEHAVYRKTALSGNTVLAMWGVCGTPFGVIGTPYLLTSEAIYSVSPIRFARIYMREMKIMSEMFPILENYVDPTYESSVRMMEISGFKLEEPVLYNDKLIQKFSVGAT